MDYVFWDAWVAGDMMDALDEQLLHRHKLSVKIHVVGVQPIQNATYFFYLDGTVCLPGAFLGMVWIYPVGMSAATFESFARLILLESFHSTPSLNLLLLFMTRANARYVLAM